MLPEHSSPDFWKKMEVIFDKKREDIPLNPPQARPWEKNVRMFLDKGCAIKKIYCLIVVYINNP